MNHKIVCWGDYAIPVPKDANWIAMDSNGIWFWYENKPRPYQWPINEWTEYQGGFDELASIDICPPEPGPWTEQLYWIGD